MKAVRTYYDPINDIESIAVNGHNLEFGGVGSGYCYPHQSFDCLENLTDEERLALHNAEDGNWMKQRTQPIKLKEIGIGVPLNTDVVWTEPPRRVVHNRSKLAQAAQECVDNPGYWRLVRVYDAHTNSANSLASVIRRNKGVWGKVAEGHSGCWEVEYSAPDEDGLQGVWARWVVDAD